MKKTDRLIVLASVLFGAYILYSRRSKSINKSSNKGAKQEEEAKEEKVASSVGGGGGPSPIPLGNPVVDEVKSKIPSEEKSVKPILVAKPIEINPPNTNKSLDIINRTQKYMPSILPTTSMGLKSPNSKTISINVENPTNKKKEVILGQQVMSNFYDFNGDDLDNEEFLID